MWEFPKIRGTVFWGPLKGCDKGTIGVLVKGSIRLETPVFRLRNGPRNPV